MTWSPDGQRLVSGDLNGLAEVWEVSTGRKVVSAHLHTARINALAWSPDGRRIASGSTDKTVRVWDPTHGEELLRFDVPDAERDTVPVVSGRPPPGGGRRGRHNPDLGRIGRIPLPE